MTALIIILKLTFLTVCNKYLFFVNKYVPSFLCWYECKNLVESGCNSSFFLRNSLVIAICKIVIFSVTYLLVYGFLINFGRFRLITENKFLTKTSILLIVLIESCVVGSSGYDGCEHFFSQRDTLFQTAVIVGILQVRCTHFGNIGRYWLRFENSQQYSQLDIELNNAFIDTWLC